MKKSFKEWCLENQDNKLLNEYSKENIYDINDITIGSKKKVIWDGACGHKWESTIGHRIRGRNCPYCNHKKVLKGQNDLLTLSPNIAKEWNYSKNEKSPEEYFEKSNKTVWWICPKGHEYQSRISNRTVLGRGCPICNKERKTSYPEQIIFFYVKQIFPSAINNFKDDESKKEIDIYIPELKIGIEYDGYYYHKNRIYKDKEKDNYFKSKGIEIIRISDKSMKREKSNICTNQIFVPNNKNMYESMKQVMQELSHLLFIDGVWDGIDIEKDSISIMKQTYTREKSKSFASLYPELLESWNWEKNDGINPYFIPAVSGRKFWWKCPKCGFEWKAKVSHRTKRNHGCSQCSGQLPYSNEEEKIIRKYYPIEGIEVLNRLPHYRTKKGLKSKIGRMGLKKSINEHTLDD